MPPVVSPVEFLKTIWGESEGYAELTAIGKTTGVKSFPWSYPGAVESLVAASVNHNKNANVYMGVCLRREKWPRNSGRKGVDGRPIIEHRGTEENALLSWVVWVEFDFKTDDAQGHKGRVVDPERARKWLAEFPLKPSIIVRSGGGIQVYWLLKEPAQGDDLWKVKAINKALVEFFTEEIDGKKYGADTQSVDLARILRIPGSMNVKYTPPRPCEISFWHPEYRYVLDDFDFLPVVSIEKPVPVLPGTTSSDPSDSARPTPSLILDSAAVEFVSKQVQALWLPGQKHHLAMLVGGLLAHSGVALESAYEIIQSVSDATGSDTPKRLKDVTDTYNNFVNGKPVSGKTSLEELIKQNWIEKDKETALRRVNAISDRIYKESRRRKRRGGGGGENGGDGDDDGEGRMGADPDFHIVKLIKFDSRPAQWSVTIKAPNGDELTATVETLNLMTYRLFRAYFFENTHCMLMEITQRRWTIMLGQAPLEVKETPKEARPEGAIETALEEFLGDAKEAPEPGMLRTYPGYDEDSRFFRFAAFKDYMREHAIKVEDRTVFRQIKHMGFASGVKRFGPKLVRVWMQSLTGGNGHQNGNGHSGGPGTPSKPNAPVQEPPEASTREPELFQVQNDPFSPDQGSSKETSDQTQDFDHV